jgi:hypothetical protein
VLFTKGRRNAQAVVLSTGNLQYKDYIGSIHRIGAIIQQSSSCNGWMFWYIVKDNQQFLIDDLRRIYRERKYGV